MGSPSAPNSWARCARSWCGPADEVAAGEALVVLDSMKMEIPVQSPIAATVASVCVEVGDVVSAGDVLVVLAS